MKKLLGIVLVFCLLTPYALSETVIKHTVTLSFSDIEREGIYSGEINDNGIPNGYGIFEATNPLGVKYIMIGNWTNGSLNGEGWRACDTGEMYIGNFYNSIFLEGVYSYDPKMKPYKDYDALESAPTPSPTPAPTKRPTIPNKSKDNINEVLSKQSDDFGNWTIDYFVDEFHLPTDQGYINNNTNWTGSFSNSATTNSLLKCQMIIYRVLYEDGYGTNDYVEIKLFEYGSSLVKNMSSSPQKYMVTMLDSEKNKTKFEASLKSRLVFSIEDSKKIIEELKKEKPISFYIEEITNYSKSTYLFTIDNPFGFSNIYKLMYE